MTLYDQYCEIMKERLSTFSYAGETFAVSFENATIVVRHGNHAARQRKWSCQAMLDLQGLAAWLLMEKRDLWFDANGNLTTKEAFNPLLRPGETPDEKLEKLINNVLDIDTDDKCFLE